MFLKEKFANKKSFKIFGTLFLSKNEFFLTEKFFKKMKFQNFWNFIFLGKIIAFVTKNLQMNKVPKFLELYFCQKKNGFFDPKLQKNIQNFWNFVF